MKEKIYYRDGYKYQLAYDHNTIVGPELYPKGHIKTDFIWLTIYGDLTIKRGYAWDGPSGPTFDTPDFMRGSLYHDVIYQLIRLGLLPPTAREHADRLLRWTCLEDGMPEFRAWYVYLAISTLGQPFADPANEKPIIIAP